MTLAATTAIISILIDILQNHHYHYHHNQQQQQQNYIHPLETYVVYHMKNQSFAHRLNGNP